MKDTSAFVDLYSWCIMTSELLQAWWEYIMRYIQSWEPVEICRKRDFSYLVYESCQDVLLFFYGEAQGPQH